MYIRNDIFLAGRKIEQQNGDLFLFIPRKKAQSKHKALRKHQLRHARGTAKRPDWGTENREEESGRERQGPAGPCEDPALSLVRRLATGQGCAND